MELPVWRLHDVMSHVSLCVPHEAGDFRKNMTIPLSCRFSIPLGWKQRLEIGIIEHKTPTLFKQVISSKHTFAFRAMSISVKWRLISSSLRILDSSTRPHTRTHRSFVIQHDWREKVFKFVGLDRNGNPTSCLKIKYDTLRYTRKTHHSISAERVSKSCIIHGCRTGQSFVIHKRCWLGWTWYNRSDSARKR